MKFDHAPQSWCLDPGPLRPLVNQLAADLASMGHNALTVRGYGEAARHFSVGLQQSGPVIGNIDGEALAGFANHHCRAPVSGAVGKHRMGKISKTGNERLRQLLVAEPIWASSHAAAYTGRTHDRFRTTVILANLHLNPTGRPRMELAQGGHHRRRSLINRGARRTDTVRRRAVESASSRKPGVSRPSRSADQAWARSVPSGSLRRMPFGRSADGTLIRSRIRAGLCAAKQRCWASAAIAPETLA